MLTPITPGFYSGIDGRLFLALTELSIAKWSGTYSCPSSDRTNSKGGGFQQHTRTVKSFDGSASLVVTNDATGDPQFEVGNTYPMICIAHDGRGYSFPAYIASIVPSSETKGDLGYDINWESNGVVVPWTNVDLNQATILTPIGVTGQGASPTGTV